MSSPSAKIIKQLFALSKNQCAFPKCTVRIVLEENNIIVGEVCHIKGLKPASARHDAAQSDDERNAVENLILMCSIHHKVIDEDPRSYTVQRLIEIKQDHETSADLAALSADDRRQFEALLDERIRLIIEHEKAKPKQFESIDQASGPMALAKEMAERKRFEKKRATLFSSLEGLEEVIRSVSAIYTSINHRYEDEKETFSTLGITLHTAEKYRVVATDEFGSQIELEGFDSTNYYRIPDNLRLQMTVFGKRPLRQPGAEGLFYSNRISGITLKPNYNNALAIVWIDDKNAVYTEDEIVDKIFDDLLKKIEEERAIRESLPEGRYRHGGQYVDMWGNPVRDDDEEEEDWY